MQVVSMGNSPNNSRKEKYMPRTPKFMQRGENIRLNCDSNKCDTCNVKACTDNPNWKCPEENLVEFDQYIDSLHYYLYGYRRRK